ncbi:serine/threonine protein kinase HT1, putative [Entamoeba invadens IP1]|uniref:serine/threonine protein kinase HT1, putative n=1 Tax=Entamoeba invadens IP1 TaxID=370355 RepID=UPI0002C3D3EA|nr:serine/threonine protein kinase HT1, putative [Entamoeba invadens IP1]ELP90574.1 serine/threonine protein kinase HT1, putative [Entamoeba invadens IP1]|eukprot:XP_004257345.1 serine/threonine protein kinase HT1, putative [Entamoeba invadens IP1]
MKDIENSNELDDHEFENEVAMLDKFRSEYIVYFFGAVFVSNKVSLVTEFAEFGSLRDLIDHKKASEIETKLRNKFMLDASKGILYLHKNGILHRDVKPDNILIYSLNFSDNVIAKLTDFGSSRNFNMMMTNMTFTKGVGTPSYMAPEVLKRDKYKKAADVYSFALTMYECFGWCFAYDNDDFTYPWKIADFVTRGLRLPKTSDMSNEQYNILSLSWKQCPNDRIEIEEVVNMLENILIE